MLKILLLLLLGTFYLITVAFAVNTPLAQQTKNFIDGVQEYQNIRRQYFSNQGPTIALLLFQKLNILYYKISKNASDELLMETNFDYQYLANHLGRNLAFLATSIFEFKDGLLTTGGYRDHQLSQSTIDLAKILPYFYSLIKIRV